MGVCGTTRLPAATASRRAAVTAVGLLVLVAGCGTATGDPAAGSAPNGLSTLVVGGSVSPVPTSSPQVRCIREVTDALRAVVVDGSTPRQAAAVLVAAHGHDSPEVQAFHSQLAPFRDAAAQHGADAAGALVWPALDTACS